MSPRGVYLSLTQIQRDALRAAQVDRLTNGDRTGVSGGGKSGSRNWPTSPNDILFELDYADRVASGVPRVTQVVQDLTGVFSNYGAD